MFSLCFRMCQITLDVQFVRMFRMCQITRCSVYVSECVRSVTLDVQLVFQNVSDHSQNVSDVQFVFQNVSDHS